ncbi:GyrI-like domain-containing protein [Clostridium autoethanogenum]|uniref:GyrI-like domain-containing protein n=1 Tax=Clostridium autoethanogenum TaxID=84023 RepID=UPI0004924B65
MCEVCFKGLIFRINISVYAKLREWVENEGYKLTNPPYEVYVTDPHQVTIPKDLVTEVYFPVKKK